MMEEYAKERNKALLNFKDFMEFVKKYRDHIPRDEVALISYHQLRTAATGLPDPVRLESYRWLKANGYNSWDDGELAAHDKEK
jgi:hypothetical protein